MHGDRFSAPAGSGGAVCDGDGNYRKFVGTEAHGSQGGALQAGFLHDSRPIRKQPQPLSGRDPPQHYLARRDADVTALQFRFGSWLNAEQTFGYEFRAALGMDDDDGYGPDVEIDRYYGAYIRGQFPSSFQVRPYGILGLTRVETTESPGHGENYDDLSLGLGAEMSVSKNVFITLEYLRVVDHGGDEISNLGLGFGGRF